MDYIELNCNIEPLNPGRDLIIAELAEIGYESFVETENGLQAYVQEVQFSEIALSDLNKYEGIIQKIEFSHKKIKDQNWNAVWESNYDAVMIEDRCLIRAPFHEKNTDVEYEIVIEPQMSFGTAHHETTAMMIRLVLEEDVNNKRILDMGCGTGVLAVLAGMRGATQIDAIDNDEWAYRNSVDNCKLNGFDSIKVIQGDAKDIQGEFDLIIANINRNILLHDMKDYIAHIKSNGVLFISGFYEYDLPILQKEAEDYNMKFDKMITKNSWTAARFIKN